MMQHSSLIGGLGGQVLTLLVVAYKFMTRPLYYFWHQFLSLTNGQKLLLGAVFGIGFAFVRVRPFWKRYIQVADIPSSMFGPYAPVLVGRAVSVTDGDTIRFLHRPTPFHPTSLSPGQKKSEFALPIRLCSIDTPGTLFYFVWGNTPRRTQWEKLHILEKYTPSGGSHRFTEAEYTCPHPPHPLISCLSLCLSLSVAFLLLQFSPYISFLVLFFCFVKHICCSISLSTTNRNGQIWQTGATLWRGSQASFGRIVAQSSRFYSFVTQGSIWPWRGRSLCSG